VVGECQAPIQKGRQLVYRRGHERDDFLVEIPGEIISFAVHTLEEIGKALAFVFDKVLGAFRKFIKFLKLLFDFKAILRIKNEIKAAEP